MIGKTISHYKIMEKLGEGGMGVVYKALDTKLNREVAIKFLPHHVAPTEEERQRFKIEAQAAAALNHPNIATIYAIEEVDDDAFIVMEYLEGKELKDVVASNLPNVLDIQKILDYATQIAEGLQAAHEVGVIHRDIKSANIIITPKERVKIMDFGLAKLRSGSQLTKEHSTLGTAAYMSPEQARGDSIDHRTDIWSFGVVMYEMLAGQLPFKGDYDSAVLYMILNEKPEPVEIHRSDIPPTVIHILNRALEKEAEERYQTMAEIARALHGLIKNNSCSSCNPFVELSIVPDVIATKSDSQATLNIHDKKQRTRFPKLIFWSISSISIAVIIFQIYLFFERDNATLPYQDMEFTQLTHTGDVREAAISPDGKSIAYVTNEQKKFSLWVRQTGAPGQIQILSLDEFNIIGPAFSREGEFIYYSSLGKLYRIPVLGGSPEKVLEKAAARISISPDGKRLAFVRDIPDSLKNMLVIVDINGSNQRTVAVRDYPNAFQPFAPAWSPDGKSLALGAVINKNGKSTRTIVEIPITGGPEKRLASFEWSSGGRAAWLPDGSGLIVMGNEKLYRLALPSGEVTRITNDLHHYAGLSMSEDGSTLASVKWDNFSSIWLMSNLDMNGLKQVSTDLQSWAIGPLQGLSWTPDNKIVCSTDISGNLDLWLMNLNGSGMKQLTFHESENIHPVVLPDGKTIIFVSNRSGSYDIWRMDINDGTVERLTFVNANNALDFCANEEWVVYYEYLSLVPELWRIPIAGGKPEKISEYWIRYPAISSDGREIVCHLTESDTIKWRIGILPIDGGEPIALFDGTEENDWYAKSPIQWTHDGKAFAFYKTENNVSNIWLQPVNGSEPQQVTDFKTERIWYFTWSRDGKYLAMARGKRSRDVVMIKNLHLN